MDMGIFCKGVFVGYEGRMETKDDGSKVMKHRYHLVNGMDSFRISSEYDYTGKLQVGDIVTFSVQPVVFQGRLYYSKGCLVDE